MVAEELNKLLNEYKVNKDFREEVREGYRLPLQEVINSKFETKPNYRYGGSLAKGTANSNSCDIDLLCYVDSDCGLSVENVYNTVECALNNSNYIYECKNSAICVTEEKGETPWEITVDVVPGKYTSNEDNKDVYLWCNKDKKRLKSNPEIQINKVKNSNMKDVIRLIKLYRSFHNFKFKSFFLEIFAIDIVEPKIKDSDNVYDKLVKFCSCYKEIGKTKIYDPANADNDIMGIHTEYEFENIRNKIKMLYEVLLTNDSKGIVDYIEGTYVNIDTSYAKDAKSHSKSLSLSVSPIFFLRCYDSSGKVICSGEKIGKGKQITFHIDVPYSIQIATVKLIVSNAGYESINCPRGNEENTTRQGPNHYTRSETTSYNGNHYVQAIVKTTTGHTYYSSPFVVKIRDYD